MTKSPKAPSGIDLEKAILARLGLVYSDDDESVWCTARKIIITGGWRAGKSTRGATRVLRQVLRPNQKGGLVWLLGPDYSQAREEFRYLIEWLSALNLLTKQSFPTEGSCSLTTKTGWTVVTKSGKYPERLGSVAPDGIVLCEPGQMPEAVYQMSIGRLMQKNGWLLAVGTLEADARHPRWVWYEQKAKEWRNNIPGDGERSFSLPSWANKVLFPEGEFDPKIDELRREYSENMFARRIKGEPVGADSPCFPELWYTDAEERYVRSMSQEMAAGLKIMDGALGVDYGATPDHPSTVVVVQQDNLGRYWVRDCWSETGGNNHAIKTAVGMRRKKYDIRKGRVDPKQTWMANEMGLNVALGSGPAPSGARIGLAAGHLSDGNLLFDKDNPEVMRVWYSMRMMEFAQDSRGMLKFDRALGDDEAQGCLYALEELRSGTSAYLPDIGRLGTLTQTWKQLPGGTMLDGRT